MKARMKSVILCSVCAVLLTTGIAHADLNNGLLAYYPFNGNANDASGQGHDGTVSGAVPTTDPFGNPASAYLFDGLDDYIEVPNTEGVFNLTSAWTMAAWCKPLDWMVSGPVIWKTATNGLNNDTFGLACHYDDWVLKLERASDDEDIAVFAPYAPGKWYYLVGTYDGQYLSLYIDGNLSTTLNCGSILAYTGEAPLMIGSTMNTNHSPKGVFNGPIDEVRIYGRALSGGEVAMLFGIPAATAIDFAPDPLYLYSSGKWVTCYMQPPDGYSVGEIDVDSILLENLLPVQHSTIQGGTLMVKFDRQDVIAYITQVLGITAPDDVTLMVTGELTDGFSFQGTDTIRVTNEKEKK
jgi:Concanavalin A-like lectin/glucanases superfamily